MKLSVSLSLTVAVSLCTMSITKGLQPDPAALKRDIMIVIGGNFSPDHLGPDEYEKIKAIILENAHAANLALMNDILLEDGSHKLSSLHIASLMRLTSIRDPQSALLAANKYKMILNHNLTDFDNSVDKEIYIRTKSEQDGNEIQRLIRARNEVQEFINEGAKR